MTHTICTELSTESSPEFGVLSTSDAEIGQIRSYDVITQLGDFSPDTLLTERALSEFFGLCPTSIKRAVERQELPPPTKVCGKPRWTVRSITTHIEKRLEAAKQEAEAEEARFENY